MIGVIIRTVCIPKSQLFNSHVRVTPLLGNVLLNQRISTTKSTLFAENDNEIHNWQPIYRLNTMPHLQAISRLKFLMTSFLLLGTPITGVLTYFNDLPMYYTYSLIGSSSFSLLTLIVLSYFSTKVVGVISVHRHTQQIRIGRLTFWGRRQNLLLSRDEIIPASDLSDAPQNSKTVRIAIVRCGSNKATQDQPNDIQQILYLTRLKSEILDSEKFANIFGFIW